MENYSIRVENVFKHLNKKVVVQEWGDLEKRKK